MSPECDNRLRSTGYGLIDECIFVGRDDDNLRRWTGITPKELDEMSVQLARGRIPYDLETMDDFCVWFLTRVIVAARKHSENIKVLAGAQAILTEMRQRADLENSGDRVRTMI